MLKKGEILAKAIHIAVEAHAGQFDKGGNPYILHPLAVMQLLGKEEEYILAAAVLHDAPEDNKKITYEYLREQGIPEETIEIVKCVTKVPGESKLEYRAKVKSNPGSIKVKKADLTHNSDIRRLKGVTQKDIERMVDYHEFYLELVAIST